jgi:hypothetical protein
MQRYRIHPELTFVEQADSSWIAMGQGLPIFLAAPSRAELEKHLATLEPALNAFLAKMADGGTIPQYLKERDIPFEPIPDGDPDGQPCVLAFTVRG